MAHAVNSGIEQRFSEPIGPDRLQPIMPVDEFPEETEAHVLRWERGVVSRTHGTLQVAPAGCLDHPLRGRSATFRPSEHKIEMP